MVFSSQENPAVNNVWPPQPKKITETYYRPPTYGNELSAYSSHSTAAAQNDEEALLSFWVYQVLLPIAMALMALCFILGVILIIKSYIMTTLRQNILMALRRRRQSGPAPDNNYVEPAEMRSWHAHSNERGRSLPPPEVLLAARERASNHILI